MVISYRPILRLLSASVPLAVVCLILVFTLIHSFLLFHTVAEMFSFLIAGSLFLMAWNARRIMQNTFFIFIAIVLLFVGVIDFFHAFTYSGMNLIPGLDANIPTQLWLAGRYLLSISLFIAPLLIRKGIHASFTVVYYIFIVALIFISIFYLRIFPVVYVEGVGLTQFKIMSEYVISVIFLIAGILLIRYKEYFDKKVLFYLVLSYVLNIVSELLFTLYVNVYDVFNALGHFAKIFAYYFIYKGVIEVGLSKPYNLLFLELQKANKQKDDYISFVSHELKTPITSIRLYSEVINKQLRKKKDMTAKNMAEKIIQQTDKMSALISDLLDVSRIETGQLQLNVSDFSLHMLLKNIVAEMNRENGAYVITYKGTLKEKVAGDKEKIEQVCVNLINNAIKYSPKGTTISIRLYRQENNALVEIQDEGIGIAEDDQVHIFDKYYRTVHGEKKAKGLGIGLYIAKEIIVQHKGKIWVESKIEKGSTFYFSLPLAQP